jgi:hypothetical protein
MMRDAGFRGERKMEWNEEVAPVRRQSYIFIGSPAKRSIDCEGMSPAIIGPSVPAL